MPFLLLYGTAVEEGVQSREASVQATGGVSVSGTVVAASDQGVLVSWVAFEVPSSAGTSATVSRSAALGATARVTVPSRVIAFRRSASIAMDAILTVVGQQPVQTRDAAIAGTSAVSVDGVVITPAVFTRSASLAGTSHVTVVGNIKGVTLGAASLRGVSGVSVAFRRLLLRSVLVHGTGGIRANGARVGISETHPPLSGVYDTSATGGTLPVGARGARPAVARGGDVVEHSRGGRVVEHPRGGDHDEESTGGVYDLVGAGGEVY